MTTALVRGLDGDAEPVTAEPVFAAFVDHAAERGAKIDI